jgi:GNAT superfamily N-acetyltransferase
MLARMPAPSLDGRVFRTSGPVVGGHVNADTEFRYRERDGVVWAAYNGGAIRHGHLVGTRDGDALELRYTQLLTDGTTATGRCRSEVETRADGRLRLNEAWAWESTAGEGTSVVDEEAPLAHDSGVELRPIVGEDGSRAVMRLSLAPGQEKFVADNACSLAQGQWADPPGWMRGIWHDDRLVGFLMLEDDRIDEGSWYLWRLMIAAGEQHKGYGRAALELVCRHIRRVAPPHELLTSWVQGEGGPEPFYLAFGFEPTGEVDDDENVARLVRWPD